MSRSGYIDDFEDNWQLIKWRGQVASASRGKRGQQFFRDLLAAMDAMPEKRLITHELEEDGEVCAIGALCRARGVDMATIDPEEPEEVASARSTSHHPVGPGNGLHERRILRPRKRQRSASRRCGPWVANKYPR